MCKTCGAEYLSDVYHTKQTDLSHIKTPEELLQFLESSASKINDPVPPCKCGLTEAEFDKTGKFGCCQCYTHFMGKMESLVFPFHGAKKHIGKYPKKQTQEKWVSNDEEKLKLLKLQYAKALELEQYEKLTDLKQMINEINQSLSSTSEDL